MIVFGGCDSILSLQTVKSQTFIDDIDPRVKMVYVLQIIVIMTISTDISVILSIFVYSTIPYIILQGVKGPFKLVWNFKWYLLGFYIIGVYLLRSITTDIFFIITMKFLVLYLSFAVFSHTTSPDEIIDSLLKLKLPANFAWSIGTTLRQVYFIYEEIANVREIQAKLYPNTSRYDLFSRLVTTVLANSIQRSKQFSKVLQSRGFSEAYSDIITVVSPFKKTDVGFFLISLLPAFIYFI